MKTDLPQTVKCVLDQADREGIVSNTTAKFVNNLPSTGWVYSFLKRHPIVSSRIPENLGFQRAYIDEKGSRKWHQGLENFLREEHGINTAEFLSTENADRIFNLDESGFPLQGTNGKCKVMAERGAKNVFRLNTDKKQQITVLACVSASGKFNKPYVIFPGIRRPSYNLADVSEDDYDLCHTENGWISADAFFEWLANLFLPSVKDTVQFPILMFMDGHAAHCNIAVSDFCRANGIIMYLFPPHASHALQPLDVSVFGPLKKLWDKSLREFRVKHRVAMTKQHFFTVFDGAWKQTVRNPSNAISGFRSTGLVPFNVENIDFSRLITSSSVAKSRNDNSKVI